MPICGQDWTGLNTANTQMSFWQQFREEVSLANYRPRPAEGVVVGRPAADRYVLKNPQAGTYMRLSPEEYALWEQMDGRRTVQELAVDYFLQHQRLMPVAELVRRLRSGHMLTDPPAEVQGQLREAVRRQREPWGRRVLALLWGHPLYLKGIDRFFRWGYRWGGRLLFTRPAIWLQRLIALAGLAAFVVLLLAGRQGYEVFQSGRSYFWGLVLLLLLNLVTLSLHESAHALSTIHQGCSIRRGGLMLYVGLPALFVDTTDTWMVEKERRIQVAIAGPWSDLVVAGLASLLALPLWAGGPIVLKIATLAYVSALFNLNPLLELDGYYALCDHLDRPTLRRDALNFLWRDLWGRLRRRQPLSPQERLYTTYGLLSLLYLAVVVGLVVLFWRAQVARMGADLLRRGVAGKVTLGVLAALVGGPLLWLVGRRLYWMVRDAWRSLEERGLLALSGVRLALVAGGSLLLPLLWRLLPFSWQGTLLPFLPLLLCGLGVIALTLLFFYEGTPFRRGLLWLALFALLLGVESGALPAGAYRHTPLLAQVAAFLAVVAALSADDLLRSRPAERAGMGLLAGGGFLLSLVLARSLPPGSPFPVVVLESLSPFLLGLTLAALLPTLVSFSGTPFAPAWVLFFLALALNGLGHLWPLDRLTHLRLDLGCAFLLAQGAILYLLARYHLPYRRREGKISPTVGTHGQLRRAFARFFEDLFALFQDTLGRRRAQAVDDRLDVIAVTANWPVMVDRGRVRESVEVEERPLEDLAFLYRDLLSRALEMMEGWAGRPFLRRAVQAAYDDLPWGERQVLARHILRHTPWGKAVSEAFFRDWNQDLRLLAGVPLFFGADEATLEQVRAALRRERVPAGRVITREGEPAKALWIVATGEVEVWKGDAAGYEHLVGELHRGDTLGVEVLSGMGFYQATGRASVESTLLRLERAALEGISAEPAHPAQVVQARARLLSWLVGQDLLQGVSWQDLQQMAARMERRQVQAGEVLFQEGRPADFYLIEEGTVLLVVGWGTPGERMLSRLGPGECLGEEGALFGRAGGTARATEECVLWVLPAGVLRRFLDRPPVSPPSLYLPSGPGRGPRPTPPGRN